MKKLLNILAFWLIALGAFGQNTVYNYTDHPEVKQMTQRGLNALEIQGVTVVLADQSIVDDMTKDGVLGYIREGEHLFTIIINFELAESMVPLVVAHELVHLWQYHSGRMIEFGFTLVTFDGVMYNLADYSYQDYPWEIEAFKYQQTLNNKIIDK